MGAVKRMMEEHEIRQDQLEIARGVLAHAKANYDRDGWDYIVECYSAEELVEVIGDNYTLKAAIKHVAQVARLHDSVRKDVQGEIF